MLNRTLTLALLFGEKHYLILRHLPPPPPPPPHLQLPQIYLDPEKYVNNKEISYASSDLQQQQSIKGNRFMIHATYTKFLNNINYVPLCILQSSPQSLYCIFLISDEV